MSEADNKSFSNRKEEEEDLIEQMKNHRVDDLLKIDQNQMNQILTVSEDVL